MIMCLMWITWAIFQQQKGTRRGEHKAMCVLYNTSRPRNLMRCHALSSALPSPCVKRTIPISPGHHTLLWSVERVLRFDVFQHRERPLWSRPPQEGAQGLARVSTHRERKEGAAYAYRGCCMLTLRSDAFRHTHTFTMDACILNRRASHLQHCSGVESVLLVPGYKILFTASRDATIKR